VQVRIAAATALIRLDQPADALLPIITEGLLNADMGVQLMSASNLGELGPKAMTAVTALLEAYKRPGNFLRKYAKQALQKIAPEICLEADEPIFAPAEPGQTGCVIIQHSHPTSTERLKDWSEAIRLDPDDIQAFRCRAKIYEQLKEWPNAALDWTEVIRLAPDDALAHIHRGQALRELGEFDRAAADCTVAIRLSPGNADAYNNRAVVWKRKGEYQRAIADYSEAIRLNPKRAGFYRNRSIAAKAAKDYAQAQADLEEVLRLAPEHAAGHNDLACFRATCADAAYRNGAEAVAHGRRACELSGWSTPGFLSTLAAAYAEASQFDDAVRWSKKALEHREQLKPAQVEEFTAHLRLYEQGQPFRAK
jgi:tetratricopeptide (TPR) repeat protein